MTATTVVPTHEPTAQKSTTLYFLRSGALIPIVFWVTTIVCGFIFGNYNHLTRMVSELGAIGTPSRYVFSAGLLFCSVLSIFFVAGLWRACRTAHLNVLPVLLILCYSVSIAGAAIFPLPLRLHLIMGMPSVLLFLSPLTTLLFWRSRPRPPYIVTMSLVSLIAMSLGFLAFFPDILSDYLGLKQRLFHLGWSIWFAYLSCGVARLVRSEPRPA